MPGAGIGVILLVVKGLIFGYCKSLAGFKNSNAINFPLILRNILLKAPS